MLRTPPSSTLFPYTTLFRSLTLSVDLPEAVNVRPAAREYLDRIVRDLLKYLDSTRTAGIEKRMKSVRDYVSDRSEEHTSELQSLRHLVCRLLLEKKKTTHAH